MSDIRIQPVGGAFMATVRPPGSKSITNRALVLAAAADGISRLGNVLFADDTLVMIEALGRLGYRLCIDREASAITVHGRGGKVDSPGAELFCGNSGTTIRFLTALCTLGKGRFVLDGVPRMRQRPIGELIELLTSMGANVRSIAAGGYPPVEVEADGLAGGTVQFGAARSSQYLSAALMAAPYAREEVSVELAAGQTSWPYVQMTMRMMDEFGVTCELYRDPQGGEPRKIYVPQGIYRGREYTIEPDASNASYFLAAAAIHPGSTVKIAGLGRHSLQGDIGFAGVLEQMGARVTVERDSITVTGQRLHGIDADMSAIPDTAQTLAVAALFASGPTTLRGLHTLRVKETDRIAALAAELTKLGANVETGQSELQIQPPTQVRPADIDTYDDHRMAMSFALAGTKAAGIVIKDNECVAKTYPNYFADLEQALSALSQHP